MMEIPKSLQVDIKNIQNQLKTAIQNHQIMVLKQRSDPSNVQIKKEIGEVQKHIMSLGESQKHLVQRLRKELEANSTHKTLTAKTVPLSLGLISTTKPAFCTNHHNNNNNNSCNKGQDRISIEREPISNHKFNCLRPVSHVSSVTSEDSQGSQETSRDSNTTDKVNFLSAVGLVTREVLSELQNRRVERKRRSTANHTQFVYGNNWDVSKRKKNSYLISGSTPSQHMTRSQRVPEVPASAAAPAASSSAPIATQSQLTDSSTMVVADNNMSAAICIPGLPASLTIERVSSPPKACVVCHKPGVLTVCSSCNVRLHPPCVDDWPHCPQCGVKQEAGDSMAVLQTYIAEHKPDPTDRKAEKLRLQQLNTQLTAEKEQMEQRASELRSSLATQAAHKKEFLRIDETVRKRIQCIHDFVSIIKTPRSVTPS